MGDVMIVPEALYNPEIKISEPIDTGVSVNYDATCIDTVRNIAKKIFESKDRAIPYSSFMQECLFGEDGYYSAGKVDFEKHFSTSPEASETFGNAIGKCAMRIWEAMGKTDGFRIVEMGAGHASLAASLLEWAHRFQPQFFDAVRYTIIEYGRELVRKQREVLSDFTNVDYIHGSAYDIPLRNVQGVFISNELPDAFPVECVKKIQGLVYQKYVTIKDNNWHEVWKKPTKEVDEYIREYAISIPDGVEEPINLNALQWQKQINRALDRGGIITIDYGQRGEVGKLSDFDAVRCYGSKIEYPKSCKDAYLHPGGVDITSSVNFLVLEIQAMKDGLIRVFSGKQIDLFNKIGIDDVVQYVKKERLSGNKWKDAVELQADLDSLIVNYHSHLFS